MTKVFHESMEGVREVFQVLYRSGTHQAEC